MIFFPILTSLTYSDDATHNLNTSTPYAGPFYKIY
jgi:hypothetical protein